MHVDMTNMERPVLSVNKYLRQIACDQVCVFSVIPMSNDRLATCPMRARCIHAIVCSVQSIRLFVVVVVRICPVACRRRSDEHHLAVSLGANMRTAARLGPVKDCEIGYRKKECASA